MRFTHCRAGYYRTFNEFLLTNLEILHSFVVQIEITIMNLTTTLQDITFNASILIFLLYDVIVSFAME